MNSIDKEYLINCSEDILKKSIYRVFKIEHLLEWFKTGKVAFCRPDEWEDPWEVYLMKFGFRHNWNTIRVLPYINLFYAKCWTFEKNESDLIWKLYSPQKTGVRIKTNIKRIYERLILSNEYSDYNNNDHHPEIFLGKVKYYQDREIKRATIKINKLFSNKEKKIKDKNRSLGKSIVSILYKKRKAFHHENEFRIVFCTNNYEDICSHSIPKLYYFSVNPLDIIDEIIFDPRMDKKTYEEHRRTLLTHKFINPITQSKLYKI